MKTAVSIEKKLYNDAEHFSHTAGLSRSKLYSSALQEYMQNHTPDIITERLNSYYADHDSSLDSGLKEAANQLFSEEDW